MVDQLWVPYEDAVRYVDRHPCNDMRQLHDWPRLTTWLRECSQRRQAELKDSLPPCCLKSHA